MTLKWSSATDQLYAVSNSSPSLDLDFASNKSLLDNISGNNLVTFSRASSGTYVGSDGLIKASPVNLLTYSEQFDQSAWIKNNIGGANASVTPNTVDAPDGTTSADSILFSPSTATLNAVYQYPPQFSQGTTATFSVYLKVPSGSAQIHIAITDDSSNPNNNVGVLCNVTTSWQRFQVTFTKGNGILNAALIGWYTAIPGTPVGPSVNTTIHVWGAQVEEGSTATTYAPTTTVASAAPRFDHDPVTGESLGLLIEESRTNEVRYSEQFDDDAYWTKSNTTITPNNTVAPDGTQSADLLYTTTNGVASTSRGIGSVSSTPYTTSVYLKSAGFTWAFVYGAQGNVKAYFNLITGVVGTVDAGATAAISSAGNGWYKCSVTQTVTYRYFAVGPADADGSNTSTSSGTSGIYAWGAQVEAGSFPTSYLPTTSSAVTRAADVASITGTNFTSWYNPTAGSFYVQESSRNNALDKFYIFISNGANNDRLWISKDSVNRHTFRVYDSTNGLQVVSASAILPSSSGLVSSKFVGSYLSGDSNSVLNGILSGASVNNAFIRSGSNSAYLGRSGGSGYLNGHISRLAYYPYRLSDTILQEITS